MREKFSPVSRREFVKKSSYAGASLMTAASLSAGLERNMSKDEKSLAFRPRYHRWHVDKGVEWIETNTTYNQLDWTIPTSQVAIVMVDVWQRHYLKDTEERSERIVHDKMVPLLESCRNHGVAIIHAPSVWVARKYDNYKKYEDPSIRANQALVSDTRDVWPPQDFRSKKGDFQKYARPFEPREEERRKVADRNIHPLVAPRENDIVVGTANELHEVCRKRGILFLLYMGFNTNACVITKEYGALEMSKKGYEVVLIRDATTGMESAATHRSLDQTRNAILFFEMFGQYSTTSDEIIKGLEA